MAVKQNPYQKTMLGSALLFLTIYIGTVVYSLFPFMVNQFFPNLDLTPMSSGWSGYSAATNSTIVDLTSSTMNAWSIGNLLPLVIFAIVIVAIIMGLTTMRYGYKYVK